MADDLNRWLRAVRPPTAADDGWSDSPEADDILASIHERTGRRRSRVAAQRTRVHLWMPAAAVAAVAVLVVAVTLNSSTPASHRSGRHSAPQLRPVAKYLSPFSSCGDLLKGLRAHAAAHVTAAGLPNDGPISSLRPMVPIDVHGALPNAAGASSTSAGSAKADSANSATNVQEVGVDEPDLVKTSDGRVVTVLDGTLRVVDASTRKVTGSLDLRIYSGWQRAQLLVSGDSALVILSDDVGQVYALPAGPGGVSSTPTTPSSTVLYVDLADNPTVTSTLHMDGFFVDGRMVGSTARIVVASQPKVSFAYTGRSSAQQIALNKAVINRAPATAWLPTYSIGQGASSQTRTVPCSQVSHPTDYTGASMITVYTVDPTAPGKDPVPVSVAADGDTVYATDTSLYVASNPQWWCCTDGAGMPGAENTEIHRFDVTGTGAPTYLGSGKVPGRLLNQYSMSDYHDQLRVATTVAGRTGVDNRVTVLDANTLTVTGQVTGIASGEAIYAVRFIGPLGYVVTFALAVGDPLFVVDLRDPAHPMVAGELKIPGYSTYLHDAGDGRLIGVGWDDGLQVSLFDVSDPAHPKRTSQVVVPDAWGGQQFDPHSFLFWEPTGLVVVPVGGGSSAQRALVTRLHGGTLTEQGTVANQAGAVQRSLIVDGQLWTVSEQGIRVSEELTLLQKAWIAFS